MRLVEGPGAGDVPHRDTFGPGADALHEALLAELTPEEEHAVQLEGARQGLRAGVPEDQLEALYGVRPGELALCPLPLPRVPG